MPLQIRKSKICSLQSGDYTITLRFYGIIRGKGGTAMKIRKLAALAAAFTIASASMNTSYCGNTADSSERTVTFTSFDTGINGGEPVRGVDISSIIAIEKAGVVFYDSYGRKQDIFKALADHGVNYIRVRVWNEPYSADGKSYGGGCNDVETAGEIGRRAAKYGMKLLVDIQYSDFWADPGKQTRPKYWSSHDHDTLKGEIYKWTKWVLEAVTAAGGDIGMVQVGNETNCFFCGEKDMYKICDLFASGNKAVRDFDRNILIAHHFANPSNTDYYLWYAKVMNECRLDYDIFATSYYPYWHGSLSNLTNVLKTIGDTYGKHVMVAETAYPYTDEDGDTFGNAVSSQSSGCDLRYEISPKGQAECLADVFQAVADTGKWGIGVFYWEPAWLGVPDIPWEQQRELWEKYGSGWATAEAGSYDKSATATGGSAYDNQALFNFHGHPLESLDVFGNIYPRSEEQSSAKGSSVDEGVYRIKNAATGMYLTVNGGEASDGADVTLWRADGAADYNTWRLVRDTDGYYRIYSELGNELMLGTSADDGVGIFTSPDNMLFKLIDRGSEGYILATKSSRDRRAVSADTPTANGRTDIRHAPANGSGVQAWLLEPVEKYGITGDINGDGKFDVFDYILLRRAYISGSPNAFSDLNGDGECNIADLVAFRSFLTGRESSFVPTEKGTPRNTIFPEKQ